MSDSKSLIAPESRRVAFLDRDGVINRDSGYVGHIENFEFLPGAVDAMRRLQDLGFTLAVVTNQSGIARGYFTEAAYDVLTNHMIDELEARGVRLAGVAHCPHLPTAAVAAYRLTCGCRKPAPGLILRLAERLRADLATSSLIGDKASDIAAGRAAGVGRCYSVGRLTALSGDARADAEFGDLLQCVSTLASDRGLVLL